MEEAGSKTLRHHKMVSRCGHCPEMYGVYASLLHGSTSNLPPMKNITAFLMNQNRQFEDVVRGLTDARDSLDGARYNLNYPQLDRLISMHAHRLRNHDLLTSLDVLTTGSYRRLPTMIKVWLVISTTR